MPVVERSSARKAQLVAAARHLLETEGVEAVTIRRLGAAVGMRGPSLYKHVPDKSAIEAAVAIEGLTELSEVVRGVPATFTDVSHAYRTWALAHPHLYRLLNKHPVDRSRVPPELEDRAADPLIVATGGDRDLARAAWATINGLIELELARRFPPDTDVDAVYSAAARAFDTARAD
ncbi:TetR/AcrR family transcriptional regulator [Agromyces humatus]|uniref:TetR/AcrR family transcriptional regulator n=1 Tax=Agromyces humatus TaxID=279573 RepID=UPI001E4B51F4|nr:TetR/AcrR family transcriptional regulator [Agromyces humatus]